MTQFLIRRFIRHPNDPQNPATRTAYGNLASGVGMACNLLLCLGKLLAGTLFGSIAIMADALNNLSDASSNVVSLIGFRLAAKAPDAEHPCGELGAAGWHHGRGCGSLHPLVGLGAGHGHSEPPAGREPQPGAGGAH